MGEISYPFKTKLIIAILANNQSAYERTKDLLKRRFGKTDFESSAFEFSFTKYYEKEFGANLKRYFLSFEKLINTEDLAKIKIFTNSLEKKISTSGKRNINIDPGYLNLSKLVLATTKDYNHRIYLEKGIFAEITLDYSGDSFRPWNWTYPDYKSQNYINVFNHIRQLYHEQIKK